jgi:nucleoside 2-deoxyribosyltransferase
VNDVKRADALLVNFEGAHTVSIGTVLEIGMARALDKPVIVNWGPAWRDNVHNHGMLRELISCETDTLDDAIRLVNWILGVGA